MKKKWILITAAALFSNLLLFDLESGANFVLFSAILIMMAYLNNPESHHKKWYLQAFLAFICSLMVLFHHSVLSHVAFFVTHIVLYSRTLSYRAGWLFSFAHAVGSVVYSHFSALDRAFGAGFQAKRVKADSQLKQKALLLVVAGALCLMFLLIYLWSSPLLRDLTENIRLNWDFMPRIIFFLVLLYVFYLWSPLKRISDLLHGEQALLNKQSKSSSEDSGAFIRNLILLVFGFMNGLLLLINILDFNQIFILKSLPAGISLSDFVHKGVWGLTFAILLGTLLIALTWFRQNTQTQHSPIIKLLIHGWIIQNGIMTVTAWCRNWWYVDLYHLTHLRIGVFLFVLMSAIGLIHLWLSLNKNKSFYAIFYFNTEVWYYALICCSLVNWDMLITRFNLSEISDKRHENQDYLLTLSDDAIPYLFEYSLQQPKHFTDENLCYLNHRIDWIKQATNANAAWPEFNFRAFRMKRFINNQYAVYAAQKKSNVYCR